MQGIDLSHASTPTVQVGAAWKALSQQERLAKVRRTLGGFNAEYDVRNATQSGQVVLGMKLDSIASMRGLHLMLLEGLLKERIDQGITLYLEPKGDKNILRAQTRGIEVKAI